MGEWNKTEVALKTLKNDESDDSNNNQDEFEKEAAILSNIRHPNIVSMWGIAISDGGKYMVMEYLQGGSLEKLIYQCKAGKKILKLGEKISLLLNVSKGMQFLHTLKPSPIIHRDLKSANILLDGRSNCKVCDFGLSRHCSTANTMVTAHVGTLFYMVSLVEICENN